jgi:hypothetical protein
MIKQDYPGIDEAKEVVFYLFRALLNGLQRDEYVFIYDDNSNELNFKLSKSITDDRIRDYIEQYMVCNFSGFSRRSSKNPDSLCKLYDAIKEKEKFKNANVNFYYTIYDKTYSRNSNNYGINLCTKERRKNINCKTKQFVQKEIKDIVNIHKPYREIYDFVGL